MLRKFQAAISGMELADLRQLAGDLTMIGGRAALHGMRPELRRPPLDEVAIFRIRVDLDHAEPPIWRRLDLRSDLPLDVVHQVLQVAFDWTDSHLHRFSLGGHPFDRTSQLFLCPYDAEEGEGDDDGGIPAADVRLDETLQEQDDVLNYLYDYGDNWELTLRLEEVLPAAPDSPSAVAVTGRCAAPPEDSGGGTDLASIAMVVDDPAHFDLDELNQALRVPYFVLREYGVDQRLVDLVNRLRYTRVGENLAQRMLTLVTGSTEPDYDEMVAALATHRWFLDRAKGGGIELTSAGYLKPDDVEAASQVVPAMGDWIGKNNREIHAVPLLAFRESLQAMGLLRKYTGTLLLNPCGSCGPARAGKVVGASCRATHPRQDRRVRDGGDAAPAGVRSNVTRRTDPTRAGSRSALRARLASPRRTALGGLRDLPPRRLQHPRQRRGQASQARRPQLGEPCSRSPVPCRAPPSPLRAESEQPELIE